MSVSKVSSKLSESDREDVYSHRIRYNQILLDLRLQVRHQEHVIENLIAERNGILRNLDSRLYMAEAQLLREQKYIENILIEKEQIIRFLARKIYSLKQMLPEVSENQNCLNNSHQSSNLSSVASPIIAEDENEQYIKDTKRNRAKSLPDLTVKDTGTGEELSRHLKRDHVFPHKNTSQQIWSKRFNGIKKQPSFFTDVAEIESKTCRHTSTSNLNEISNRRRTSNSGCKCGNSFGSGISNIKSRNMPESAESNAPLFLSEAEKNLNQHTARSSGVQNSHNNTDKIVESGFRNNKIFETENQKLRRSFSSGNLTKFTRSLSFSSEKTKDSQSTISPSRNSSSGAEINDLISENKAEKSRFINSTNKTFGTNHRSVTKPRDVKYRSILKNSRSTESNHVNADNMSVRGNLSSQLKKVCFSKN